MMEEEIIMENVKYWMTVKIVHILNREIEWEQVFDKIYKLNYLY